MATIKTRRWDLNQDSKDVKDDGILINAEINGMNIKIISDVDYANDKVYKVFIDDVKCLSIPKSYKHIVDCGQSNNYRAVPDLENRSSINFISVAKSGGNDDSVFITFDFGIMFGTCLSGTASNSSFTFRASSDEHDFYMKDERGRSLFSDRRNYRYDLKKAVA